MTEATGGRLRPAIATVDPNPWISLHVFYHGSLDELLRAVVPPLTARLAAAALADDLFFLRYWEGGNHVRLRVRPRSPDCVDGVRRLMREHATRYVTARPSRDVQSPVDYAELAARLSAGERKDGYARQMYPNNSTAFVPYEREHDRYGHGRSLAAVEDHFVESSRLALTVLADGTDDARRGHLAFSLIVLTWLIGEPALDRLAAATVNTGSEGGARLASARPELVRLTRRLRDVAVWLRSEPVGDQPVGDQPAATGLPERQTIWSSSLLRVRAVLAEEITAGRFVPPRLGWRGPAGLTADPVDARALPVLDLCAHLACNRLGVLLPEEGALRRLAAQAVAAVAEEER
jgi:hypothetical protein